MAKNRFQWSLASTNLNRRCWLIPLADHRITRTSDPLGKGISPIITSIRGTVAMIIRQVLRWRSGWVVPADATWPTKRWTVAVSLYGPFLSCNGVEIETEICNPGAIVLAAKTQEYELHSGPAAPLCFSHSPPHMWLDTVRQVPWVKRMLNDAVAHCSSKRKADLCSEIFGDHFLVVLAKDTSHARSPQLWFTYIPSHMPACLSRYLFVASGRAELVPDLQTRANM